MLRSMYSRWTLAAVGLVAMASVTAAEEIGVRLEGAHVDGSRHIDRIYLCDPTPAVQFVKASWTAARQPAGRMLSDSMGRGVWRRDTLLDIGEWKCVHVDLQDPSAGERMAIWMQESTGQVVYRVYDTLGTVVISGRGQRR